MPKQAEVSKFEIYEVDGHPFLAADMRVVLLVDRKGDKFLNLDIEFGKAKNDIKRGINTAIEKWKLNQPDKKRHHGWDVTQHDGDCTDCYVFKHKAKRVRVYGYLIHPKPLSRVVCCVLMHYATKNEDETDTRILNDLIRLGTNIELKKQVEEFYVKHLSKKEQDDEG